MDGGNKFVDYYLKLILLILTIVCIIVCLVMYGIAEGDITDRGKKYKLYADGVDSAQYIYDAATSCNVTNGVQERIAEDGKKEIIRIDSYTFDVKPYDEVKDKDGYKEYEEFYTRDIKKNKDGKPEIKHYLGKWVLNTAPVRSDVSETELVNYKYNPSDNKKKIYIAFRNEGEKNTPYSVYEISDGKIPNYEPSTEASGDYEFYYKPETGAYTTTKPGNMSGYGVWINFKDSSDGIEFEAKAKDTENTYSHARVLERKLVEEVKAIRVPYTCIQVSAFNGSTGENQQRLYDDKFPNAPSYTKLIDSTKFNTVVTNEDVYCAESSDECCDPESLKKCNLENKNCFSNDMYKTISSFPGVIFNSIGDNDCKYETPTFNEYRSWLVARYGNDVQRSTYGDYFDTSDGDNGNKYHKSLELDDTNNTPEISKSGNISTSKIYAYYVDTYEGLKIYKKDEKGDFETASFHITVDKCDPKWEKI